jgi:hypothetical protein
MNHLNSADDLSLSPSLVTRIDEVCDRFEAQWKAGGCPKIEDYAAGWGGPERARLLRHLLDLELDYQRKAGREVRLDAYLARFPEDADLLREVVADSAAPGGPTRFPARLRQSDTPSAGLGATNSAQAPGAPDLGPIALASYRRSPGTKCSRCWGAGAWAWC